MTERRNVSLRRPFEMAMRLLGILFALLTFAALVPDTGAAATSKCRRLARTYKDRNPHRKVVVVVRDGFETGSIVACVLPHGKIRRLASWDDGLGRESGGLAATRDYFALVTHGWSDQYGGRSYSIERVDIRTGKRVPLAGYGCGPGESGPTGGCPTGTSYDDVVLGRLGAGAIETSDLATGVTTLVGFDRAGRFTTLGTGPVERLRIEGNDFVWVSDGAEHRAPVPRS